MQLSTEMAAFAYMSLKIFYDWEYKGTILESKGKLGTMMECPDMFELNGKWVVTCSYESPGL